MRKLFDNPYGGDVRLAVLAVALVVGEGLAFSLPVLAHGLEWIVATILWCVVTAAGLGWRPRGWAIAFLAGFTLALWTERRRENVFAENIGLDGVRAPLDLRVNGEARYAPRARKGGGLCTFWTQTGPLPLKVTVPWEKSEPLPKPGETWRCDGWICHGGEGAARWRRHLLWVPERTRATCLGRDRLGVAIGVWSALGNFLAMRAGIGLESFSELADLNRAMLLGRRSDLSRERREMFCAAGTIHVFAISGLHVMVVSVLLGRLLASLGLGRVACGLTAVPLLAAYVALTGGRPSALRALLMATLWFLAPAIGRKPNMLAAWSATAIMVYAHSPERLFDLGCTFSFTVMLGIVLWCRWKENRASPLPAWRNWEPSVARWVMSKVDGFLGGMAVSGVAWIAGVPVAAMALGCFTAGGLVANLVVVVCAGWVVTLGVWGIVLGFLAVPLGAICNLGAAGCTWLMTSVSERVASWPWSTVKIAPWSPVRAVAWYVGWLGAFWLLGKLFPKKGATPARWWSLKRTRSSSGASAGVP